jgi:hypothetical protein
MTLFLLLLLPQSPADVRNHGSDASRKTLEFLKSCSQEDGGYAAEPNGKRSSLSATSAALRSIRHFGGAPEQPDRTKRFVWSCFRRGTGQFADQPEGKLAYRATVSGIFAVITLKEKFTPADVSRLQQRLYQTDDLEELRLGAAGIEALVLEGQLDKVPAEWQKHLTRVFKKELQADGTYGQGAGQARTTGGIAAAYLRLGFPIGERSHVIEVLMKGQHESGGWTNDRGEPDVEATYRVMRCLYLLRVKDKGVLDRCKSCVERCRKSDGGYGNLVGTSAVSTTYFAGSILNWISDLEK